MTGHLDEGDYSGRMLGTGQTVILSRKKICPRRFRVTITPNKRISRYPTSRTSREKQDV
jgi:hypothetical protein